MRRDARCVCVQRALRSRALPSSSTKECNAMAGDGPLSTIFEREMSFHMPAMVSCDELRVSAWRCGVQVWHLLRCDQGVKGLRMGGFRAWSTGKCSRSCIGSGADGTARRSLAMFQVDGDWRRLMKCCMQLLYIRARFISGAEVLPSRAGASKT